MAQNITLLGASYSEVPAVTLPKTGGGTARFDDASVTTATAADVAQGKIFLASDGTPTQGTNTGGGGASNFVHGTFTTSTSTGTAQSVAIPYTGSGYPIAAIVVISGGAYNNSSSGNKTWYNSTQKYAVGQWTLTKTIMDAVPTYSPTVIQNAGVTTTLHKNSTSNAMSYASKSSVVTNAYSSSDATDASATCVRFRSATSMSVYIASNSYGLLANTEYDYYIVYSS